MSIGLAQSGKIDEWMRALAALNLYDMDDVATQQTVAYAMTVHGTPQELTVPRGLRERMLADELTPIRFLRVTDVYKDVFIHIDNVADALSLAASNKYREAVRQLRAMGAITYSQDVLNAANTVQMRARLRDLRIRVAESVRDTHPSQPSRGPGSGVAGLYDAQLSTVFLYTGVLSFYMRAVSGFVFVLVHEMAHVVDPCTWEAMVAGRRGLMADPAVYDAGTHCPRYKYVLLELCDGLGLVRKEIKDAAAAKIAQDLILDISAEQSMSAFESPIGAEIDAGVVSSKFRLRSESIEVPRSRFVRGLARRNYAEVGSSMARAFSARISRPVSGLVSVGGVSNMFDFDTEAYPLDILTRYMVDGEVAMDDDVLLERKYGLYMQFIPSRGVFVYLYTSPSGDVTECTMPEAYWLLN
jgi:hypothetical protein